MKVGDRVLCVRLTKDEPAIIIEVNEPKPRSGLARFSGNYRRIRGNRLSVLQRRKNKSNFRWKIGDRVILKSTKEKFIIEATQESRGKTKLLLI